MTIINWLNKKEQNEYVGTKTIYPNRWILAKIFGIIAVVLFITAALLLFVFPKVEVMDTHTSYIIINPSHLFVNNILLCLFLISLVISLFNLIFATTLKKKKVNNFVE